MTEKVGLSLSRVRGRKIPKAGESAETIRHVLNLSLKLMQKKKQRRKTTRLKGRAEAAEKMASRLGLLGGGGV